uniref:fructose-bisphosphatase n=2 Tax=Chromera velia TaxID=505693 RepID=X2DAQ1_9ALVE|nr:chloroplast sedoheptulose-1,7-bisphosphatase [Chromera velia]|eukprot:Cvel_4538.t1-p1 / transcript=Cvel_4538.t1 / gene=Cvel_4538 / organism=Chromera_velia_CCMP2878 / gene_product=Sedoheptulose-1,7-bisphosphatase, chloroplastic, putative / transcript_product=Sedoheptulose-1,7-bisphosphatase, chloroplastic, putative / location=Cvel_scaffold199:12167-15044(-) / protein_length=316 / sequence_SO=supercontig / SO=protein_coding / is_pseudo=false
MSAGLDDHLARVPDSQARRGLSLFCDGIKEVAAALKNSQVTSIGTSNHFGDEQLSVDVIADKILFGKMGVSGVVRGAASEELPELRDIHEEGSLVVAWDPLDGSSIVDCNWAVGTIAGFWKCGKNGMEWKGKDTLVGASGRQQVASVLAMYGPRTTLLLWAEGDEGVHEYTLHDQHWYLSNRICNIKEKGAKLFSPANLRAAQDLPPYKELIDFWMTNRYTLRYTGGLVPDVYQMFIKGHGVFANPASAKAPAKLRAVFECAPIAMLVEAAGGKTSDGKQSILDLKFNSMDHRTPFCAGSAEEVERFEKVMASGSQ